MIKVKALAVMTRPELEKALEQMNVTRRDMHKLIELQHARIAELEGRVRVLRTALKSAAPVINCLDVYGRYLPVKFLIADVLAQPEPRP